MAKGRSATEREGSGGASRGQGAPASGWKGGSSGVSFELPPSESEESGGGEEGPTSDEGVPEGDEAMEAARGNESDSSGDEEEVRNTVGNVPLEWYRHEDHLGYDRFGSRLEKDSKRGDALDAFLRRADDPKAWRTIYDRYNDREITLSKEEIDTIRRIREGKYPSVHVDAGAEMVNWAEDEGFGYPMIGGTEPKRRFVPSKHEAKQIVRLVRSIRRGWITPPSQRQAPGPHKTYYLMWSDDGKASEKTSTGLSYIPPPKPKLPGHEESYRPPPEYLLSEEEERIAKEEEDSSTRSKIVPRSHDSLRRVPQYERIVHEHFERCLDLYLCPRTRKQRWNIDPKSLLPKLPQPHDLRPYPTSEHLRYEGHTAPVHSLATDRRGQWLATGCNDGKLRIFEVVTARKAKEVDLGEKVVSVEWCPKEGVCIVAACAGSRCVLVDVSESAGVGEEAERTVSALASGERAEAEEPGEEEEETRRARSRELATWRREGWGVEVSLPGRLRAVRWHPRGDYFMTVAPAEATRAVLVHQLSKWMTQSPFRRSKGRVSDARFHPGGKPYLYVATLKNVLVYNLAKQALSKRLSAGVDGITSLSLHPGGDNLIVGSTDSKVCWFDTDLSSSPYKTLRGHSGNVQSVDFHPSYPLFASASDDGTLHVMHGMVYSDLLQNPLIVPLKVLRSHRVVDFLGVLAASFHPSQPWLFSAGADCTVRLFCND